MKRKATKKGMKILRERVLGYVVVQHGESIGAMSFDKYRAAHIEPHEKVIGLLPATDDYAVYIENDGYEFLGVDTKGSSGTDWDELVTDLEEGSDAVTRKEKPIEQSKQDESNKEPVPGSQVSEAEGKIHNGAIRQDSIQKDNEDRAKDVPEEVAADGVTEGRGPAKETTGGAGSEHGNEG